MTFIRNFTLRNGLALVALFVCLGGTATAASLITGNNIRDNSVTGADIKRGSLHGTDIRDGSINHRELSEGVWTKLQEAARDSTGAKGEVGAVGAAGPQGARGQAGIDGTVAAQGVPGVNGADGAKGDTGDTGEVGAAGAFVVKDSNDLTAGTLLGIEGNLFTFYFNGHQFMVDPHTGALRLPEAGLFYVSADCTGPAFTHAVYGPRQAALRSSNTDDTALYTMTTAPSTIAANSVWGGAGNCVVGPRTEVLAGVQAIPVQDLPPSLVGPLRYVPAG